MNFLKKHIFLILCIVAILIGLGFFVPAVMIHAGNVKEFQRIKAEYGKVTSLRSKVVPYKAIEQIKQLGDRVREDAQKVKGLVQQTSLRPLIFEKVFPKPWSESSKIIYYRNFAENYSRFIEGLIAQQLRGGDRPSDVEEAKVLQDYRQSSGGSGRSLGLSSFRPSSGGYGRLRSDTPESKLIDDLRLRRAKDISLYVSSDSFCCYDYWKEHSGTGEAEELLIHSWFSQIAAWIQEDVALSIAELNQPDKSVLDNPVKRLVEISFGGTSVGLSSKKSTAVQMGGNRRTASISRRDPSSSQYLPAYVQKVSVGRSEDKSLTGHLATPFTDRVSDDLVDVVHFDVAVIIDTSRLIDFINALQSTKHDPDDPQRYLRNQITVLDFMLEPVDPEAEKMAGYHYGEASLGAVRMVCEYFFFKQGYDKFKPDVVKEMSEQEQTTTAQPGLNF